MADHRTAPLRRTGTLLHTLALCSISLLVQGCGAGSTTTTSEVHDSKSQPSPSRHATLTITSDTGSTLPELKAVLVLPSELLHESPVDIIFPSTWAGRSGFLQDIHDIEAFTDDAAPARIVAAGPGRLLIHHNGLSPITISWTLRPETSTYDDTTRFRAINHDGRIFAPAHALLAQPVNLGDDLAVQLATADGDILFTPSSARQSTFAEIVNGAFIAGPWTLSDQICGGERLRIASIDAIPDTAQRRICETIRAQRGLHRHSSTFIVIAPRQDQRTSMTGSSFDGGFLLELPDGQVPASSEFIELVAHEEMHRLIGHHITLNRGSEADLLWFLEGTTEYLAFRTLAAAGLIDGNRLLQRFEQALDSAASDSLPSLQAEGLWDDEELRRMHYDHGLLVSLALDLALLESPPPLDQPGPGLRGLVTWLGQLPRSERTGITPERLRSLLRQYAGDALHPDWFDPGPGTFIPSSLPEQLHRQAGIRIRTRQEQVPFFGLRAAMTASGTWYIVEVQPDSPASRSGLHAGQLLASPPNVVTGGRTSIAALEVSLPTPGGQRTLRLSPASRITHRHDLDIVDPARFRSFLITGDGAPGPRPMANRPPPNAPHDTPRR